MSAFLVENETINSVVFKIGHKRGNTSWDLGHIRRLIQERLGCDLSTREGCEELASSMHALNEKALQERYGDDPEGGFQYKPEPNTQLIQVYKNLRCWIYQCCEGSIPDDSLLFATMEEVSAALAHQIVQCSPEYEKASW